MVSATNALIATRLLSLHPGAPDPASPWRLAGVRSRGPAGPPPPLRLGPAVGHGELARRRDALAHHLLHRADHDPPDPADGRVGAPGGQVHEHLVVDEAVHREALIKQF